MAANSDGSICEQLTTILTCEGDLDDPKFPTQLNQVVGSLNDLFGGEVVKVRKLEPWNSVRVTLSIPREAALRLRQLATEGSQQLRALGILSVQVEGDQVISLRLAANSLDSNPQEIILRTAQDGSSNEPDLGLSKYLTTAPSSSNSSGPTTSGPSTSAAATPSAPPANSANNSLVSANSGAQVQFKSPNVVCPPDSVVPKVGSSLISGGGPINTVGNSGGGGKVYNGPPFPFASMNQAIHSNRNETNTSNSATSGVPFNSLPPPYPGKSPVVLPVTISSPLLVNLLQNEGGGSGAMKEQQCNNNENVVGQQTVSKALQVSASAARSLRTSIEQQQQTIHKPITVPVSVAPVAAPSTLNTLVKQQPNLVSTQANLLGNNSMSPSALSTNTSITKQNHSTILTSTTVSISTPPSSSSAPQQQQPPPQYNNRPTAAAPVLQIQQQHSVTLNSQQQITGTNISTMQATVAGTSNTLSHPSISSQSNMHHTLSQTSLYNSQMQNMIGVQQSSGVNLPNLVQTKPINQQQQQQAKLHCVQQQPIMTQTNNGNMYLGSGSTPHSNNVLNRNLPSPPPYSVAISRPWDSLVHSTTPLLDLTPTLTDLKPDDLDELLPTLERELTHSPLPDLGDDLTSLTAANPTNEPPANAQQIHQPSGDKRKFLINPLTGELEPHSSEESDMEDLNDVFTGLPSPAALSDDDTNSTIRPDTTTDQSDTETNRNNNETTKIGRIKNNKVKDRGRDASPSGGAVGVVAAATKPTTEKIKLRLKLEKSEPVNPAYKVDISFINPQQPKKASTSSTAAAAASSLCAGAVVASGGGGATVTSNATSATSSGGVSEELRVPPLHISLRGRNSIVIKNKTKLNPDGTVMKGKVRKSQEHLKRKSDTNSLIGSNEEIVHSPTGLGDFTAAATFDTKKLKKFKTNQEHKDLMSNLSQEGDLKSKLMIHSHYNKEKQKERRGSDSELVKSGSKRCLDSNGLLNDEKKQHQRRLSQSEQLDASLLQPTILGSTNVGTIMALPQKLRKEKLKMKDGLKQKDLNSSRNKLYVKCEKNSPKQQQQQQQQVALPTAGEIDMEAKFKQGLLEGSGASEKGIPRPPHRTTEVHHLITENSNKIVEQTIMKEQREPDKCNTPERKSSTELNDKQSVVVVNNSNSGNRSPNSGGTQGEDSGIESMDALSEKSPNQASQSPHADIIPPNNNKQQVPDMLDIEAQLAKMEGINGGADNTERVVVCGADGQSGNVVEVNSVENATTTTTTVQSQTKCDGTKNATATLNNCCELTCALQDSLKQGTVSLTATTQQSHSPITQQGQMEQEPDVSLVSLKMKKEEDLDPLPLRVTPALYTYSNPDKVQSRGGSESPSLTTDEDSMNPYESTATTTTTTPSSVAITSHTTPAIIHNSNNKSKSLLEQLLIEIPNDHHQSNIQCSPSPATRSSVKTRALSKLNSPELLNSPQSVMVPQLQMKNVRQMQNVTGATVATAVATTTTTATVNLMSSQQTTKRKRNESDSSSHSVDEGGGGGGGGGGRKKTRKCSENAAELIKACMGVDGNKLNNIGKKASGKIQQDESSDSDEPLIEKVRKTPQTTTTGNNANSIITKTKLKSGAVANAANNNKQIVGTRRSVRTNMPAQNTRSKVVEKVNSEASEAIRRKTRSAVSDVENKRKRELK